MRLSTVVVLRTFRPLIVPFGGVIWIGYRLFRILISNDWKEDPTLLVLILQLLEDLQTNLWMFLVEHSPGEKKSSAAFSLITFWFQIVQDVLGILAVMGMARISYCILTFSYNEWKTSMEDNLFEWAKDHIPAVSQFLEKETQQMIPEMEESLGKGPFQQSKIMRLPNQGHNPKGVWQQLRDHAKQENATWKQGKLSGTVYVDADNESHIQLMKDTYGLYSLANVLHPGIWPRLNQCEAEVIAITSDLLHGTNVGCTTSGGTESIMLAIKAHWVYYGKRRRIAYPELICSSTAHAAVDKACEVMNIRKVVIDADETNGYTLCPTKVQSHITSNTIMIYASAPCYPQGTIDPIEALGKLSEAYDIGLHVDACLGGFVLPFSSAFPLWDFRVPGVTSMSADTHKFGYAPKGTSVVLHRDTALRHAQYFSYAQWTGGMYATPTFAGSRPSALIGCAWAALVSIGREGYQQRTHAILDASQTIAQGIQDTIPELYVLSKQKPSMVVCFGSKGGIDIYRIADAMKEKGWYLNSLQHPPCVHVCVTLPLAPRANDFLTDLKQSVAQVRKEDPSHSKKGTAGMYGMAGSIPEGPVNEFLHAFLDISLTA